MMTPQNVRENEQELYSTSSWPGAPHRPFEGMEQTNTDVIYKQLHLKGFKYSRVCPSTNRYPWFTRCRDSLVKVDFRWSLVQHLEQLFRTSKRKRSCSGGHHIFTYLHMKNVRPVVRGWNEADQRPAALPSVDVRRCAKTDHNTALLSISQNNLLGALLRIPWF